MNRVEDPDAEEPAAGHTVMLSAGHSPPFAHESDTASHSPRPMESTWQLAGPAAGLRLGPRMMRVAVVGAVAGGTGLAAVVISVHATDLVRDAFLTTYRYDIVPLVANGLTAAAAALFTWLLFYSLRLALRTGRLTPRDATDNLRKLRIVACALLVVSLAGLVIGVTGDGPFGETVVTVGGCVASAVCCYVLISLRRAAWDVALIEGASVARPGDTRGFAVLAPAANSARVAAAPREEPAPHAPLATAHPVAAPANLPATLPAAVLPLSTDRPEEDGAAAWDDTSPFRDWEILLMALAVLAIGVYVFRVPATVRWLTAIVDNPRSLKSVATSSFGRTRLNQMEAAESWIFLASIAMSLIAAAWVVWGIVCLTAGPRLRRTTIALAAATLCVVAVILGVYLLFLADDHRSSQEYGYRIGAIGLNPFDIHISFRALVPTAERITLECVFPVVLLFVLTRGPVKELYSRKLRRARRGR